MTKKSTPETKRMDFKYYNTDKISFSSELEANSIKTIFYVKNAIRAHWRENPILKIVWALELAAFHYTLYQVFYSERKLTVIKCMN